MIICGLDPGFANVGWCLMEIHSKPFKVLAMGLLRTEKARTKDNVLATDDNFRRARKIARFIAGLCTGHSEVSTQGSAALLCLEGMSHMRNAGTMTKVALAYGTVAAIAESLQIPCVQASPAKIKKACGVEKGIKKDASKAAVIAALQKRYPETVAMTESIPKTKREHPYDALGAIEACRESEIFITLLSMARREAILG